MNEDKWYEAWDTLVKMDGGAQPMICFYCESTGVDPEVAHMSEEISEEAKETLGKVLKSYLGIHLGAGMLAQIKAHGTRVLWDLGFNHLEVLMGGADLVDNENIGHIHYRIGRRLCPICKDSRPEREAVIRFLRNNKPRKEH